MRILRLMTGIGRTGGMQTYTKNMARALAERGHDVHILSCGGEDNRDFQEGKVLIHVRRQRHIRGARRVFRCDRSTEAVELAIACWREAKYLGVAFDVVEIPDYRAEGLLLTLFRKQAVVARLHTRTALEASHDPDPGSIDLRLLTKLEGLGPRWADGSTCCTGKLIGEMRSAGLDCGPAPVVVRHPAASLGPTPSAVGRLPLVLAVGRLESRKAPEVLIQAVHNLSSDVPDAEIVFVGRLRDDEEGRRYRDHLGALSRDLGVRAHFEGEVADGQLHSFYEQARVVAIPSHQEGFSNVGMEAMLKGRPIVCSSGAGIAEIIRNTHGGKVFAVGDPDQLAQALRPFLMDEQVAARAGAAARAVAITEFSPELFAQRMEKIYISAIEDFKARRAASRVVNRTR